MSFTIQKLLEELTKLKPPVAKNKKIEQRLLKIIEICNANYANSRIYGHSHCNRKVVLDKEIAKYLTPDVLAYILSNPESDTFSVKRSGTKTTLKQILIGAFETGAHVVKYMPNNDKVEYDSKQYQQQKVRFEEVTRVTMNNLVTAFEVYAVKAGQRSNAVLKDDEKGKTKEGEEEIQSGSNGVELEEIHLEEFDLNAEFDKIVSAITKIRETNGSAGSAELLECGRYPTEMIRGQSQHGLGKLVRSLGLTCSGLDKNSNNNQNIVITGVKDLDDFCEKVLNSEAALLNKDVSHLFYDRLHIEAALEQDIQITLVSGSFTFEQLFKCLIEKIANSPGNYPAIAKEQFCVRLQLVRDHLEQHFAAIMEEVNSNESEKSEDNSPNSSTPNGNAISGKEKDKDVASDNTDFSQGQELVNFHIRGFEYTLLESHFLSQLANEESREIFEAGTNGGKLKVCLKQLNFIGSGSLKEISHSDKQDAKYANTPYLVSNQHLDGYYLRTSVATYQRIKAEIANCVKSYAVKVLDNKAVQSNMSQRSANDNNSGDDDLLTTINACINRLFTSYNSWTKHFMVEAKGLSEKLGKLSADSTTTQDLQNLLVEALETIINEHVLYADKPEYKFSQTAFVKHLSYCYGLTTTNLDAQHSDDDVVGLEKGGKTAPPELN